MRHPHLLKVFEPEGAVASRIVNLPLPFDELVKLLGISDTWSFIKGMCTQVGLEYGASSDISLEYVGAASEVPLNMQDVVQLAVGTGWFTYVVTFSNDVDDDLPACNLRMPISYNELVEQLGYFYSDRMIAQLCNQDPNQITNVRVCEETQDYQPTSGAFSDLLNHYKARKAASDHARPGPA